MTQRLDVAIEGTKVAGAIVEQYFETSLEHHEKEDTSIVTKADQEAEARIMEIISAAFPQDTIVGEEGAAQEGTTGYEWYIDPIDGTANFANSIPIFAISVGVLYKGKPVVGVVYNPITSSLFYAEEGGGAYWNGTRIEISKQEERTAMATLGCSRKEEDRRVLENLFIALRRTFATVRVLSCCSLELCYLARGGTEVFIGLGLKKWDYAAGMAIALEAGATVTGLDGAAWDMEKGHFMASNGVVHQNVVPITKDAY